jgi:hypothetical protein
MYLKNGFLLILVTELCIKPKIKTNLRDQSFVKQQEITIAFVKNNFFTRAGSRQRV